MNDFVVGQRWISDAESRLGLGTVINSEHRTVTIAFHATGDTRAYAKQGAPLTRVIFNVGDAVTSEDSLKLVVENVSEEEGLVTYQGRDEKGKQHILREDSLANTVELNRPADRLFNGQTDSDKWFQARYQTLQQKNKLAKNALYGLSGTRTSLIPHQLYIANEVAHRYAPRVLLADEVGLGKTIEAGMIIHHQILTERSQRVLIVVPESLVHQWLVEMLRKFNLTFSIFDEERCYAIQENDKQVNPFHTEQFVICSLEFLMQHENYYQQCLAAGWDLLVADEVHHLHWSLDDVSQEYEIIEQLASSTSGVLLLTATPEQLGKESHYARLRLLDPNRFPDFDRFVEEEKNYEPIAKAVEQLFSDEELSSETQEILKARLHHQGLESLNNISETEIASAENRQARNEVIDSLLDHHGTGRVLFRNTRATIKGFPGRESFPYPLPLPNGYEALYAQGSGQVESLEDVSRLLCPEVLYSEISNTGWEKFDPRIKWLLEQFSALKDEKILVICAHASTAIEISKLLKIKEGMNAVAFHEGLSLVERDRAAAYFADEDEGSQVLICSEIGSEGRNFQFAHHLILFDLPLNPDLLEQRIGRLDRIGQRETINIHIPYIEGTPQEVMYQWYQHGLGAFNETCPAGQSVFEQLKDELLASITQNEISKDLVRQSAEMNQSLKEAMETGRDKLLEYGSCRPEIAEGLKEKAKQESEDDSLSDYMELIFDCIGINHEAHSEHTSILTPGERLLSPFPGLTEEGMTVTYSRESALVHENRQYLTWEHPMVSYAMDMVLSSELGNATVCTIQHEAIKQGTLIMEALYALEAVDQIGMHSERFLPPTTIRLCIDEHGRLLKLDTEFINQNQTRIAPEIIKEVINIKSDAIKILLDKSKTLAENKAPKLKQEARLKADEVLQTEVNRLQQIAEVNPNVRNEEIEYFQQQLDTVENLIETAAVRLDALRVAISL